MVNCQDNFCIATCWMNRLFADRDCIYQIILIYNYVLPPSQIDSVAEAENCCNVTFVWRLRFPCDIQTWTAGEEKASCPATTPGQPFPSRESSIGVYEWLTEKNSG